MLKDEKDFVGLNYDSRIELIEKAKKTLVPLIDAQWKSHVEQINDGQDVKPFDLDLVAEVLPEEAANAMIQQETIFRDTADNVKTIHRSSEQDVFEVAQGFIQEAKEMYLYDKAKDIEKFYNSIVAQRSEDIKSDPVEYTIRTSPDIKNLVQKLESEQNPDIAASLSKEIAVSIMEYQTNNLGIKKTNQKVMTNSASKQFITEYKQAAKDKNINLQDAMLQGLVTKYGNLEDEALAQLTLDGLPTGARFISAGFATQEDKMKFLSLDDPNIIKDLKKDLQDRDDSEISFAKMRSLIRQDSNFKDLENIIKRNVPFDPSDEIPIIEDVVEFLAGYGSLEFTNGDTKTFNAAAKKAVEMFTKNFDIEDTYYYEKTFIDSTTGKRIIPQKIERNKEMMETIKNNYLSKLNLSSFSSKKEGITNQELTEKMQYNMREHGEWRNSPDGKGFVFGVVLSGNSFGVVEYENGDPLYFPKDYDGDTIPGSDIVVDLDIESKIQMSRGYFGYQEKMNEKDFSLGKRPSEIPEGAFGETIGIPNMDAEASELSPSIDSSFETYIKDVENKKLKSGNVKYFRHKSPEGGLDTIGFGHKLTPEEQKTNTVYGYDLSTITKDNVEEISNDILKKDLQKTEQILIKTHGEKFINLDSRRKQMLIDFQFNVRNFKNKDVFPLFKKALFAGDEEGMKREYKRFFKSNGKTKSLARNDFFKKYFLDK